MTENYAQPGKDDVTLAVDRLQQDVRANVLRSLLSAWDVCFITSPLLHSSSAAAATTRVTGRQVASSRWVKRRAGWSLTAAAKPSPRCAAGGTTPPTSTRWRSVHHQRTPISSASFLFGLRACCDVLLASAGRVYLQVGPVSGWSPPGYWSGGDRRCLPAGKNEAITPQQQFTLAC